MKAFLFLSTASDLSESGDAVDTNGTPTPSSLPVTTFCPAEASLNQLHPERCAGEDASIAGSASPSTLLQGCALASANALSSVKELRSTTKKGADVDQR